MMPTLIADYLQAPGRCYLCKACKRHPGERIVDCGVELEAPVTADPNSPGFQVNYLTEPLVICETCIAELAGMVGMAPEATVVAARVELASTLARLDQAERANTDLRGAVEGLQRAGFAVEVPAERELVAAESEGGARCDECDREFKNELGLAQHIGRRHPDMA